MTVEEIKKALAGGFQQMNTSKTEHGPYEYDRNSDLIGRPYQQPYFAMKMSDEEYLEFVRALKQREARIDEAASGMLALLILVFAGVVLWKVWVG